MRLQVFLSRTGLCSRRRALDIVKAGEVEVNERKVSEPSFEVDPASDKVVFEGRQIKLTGFEYILLNKPPHTVTTRKDRFAPKTVFDLLPKQFSHLFPVGRLDKESEGLLILTNDGGLCHRLTHPSFKLVKKYLVLTDKPLTEAAVKRFEKGVRLEDVVTAPARVERHKNANEFFIFIHEGRKRQIRRMCESVGLKVLKLARVSYGPLTIQAVASGGWRRLTEKEVQDLKTAAGL